MISGKSSPGWYTVYSDSQSLKLHCCTVLLPSHAIPSTSLSVLLLVTPVSCDHIVCNSDVVWFPLCCKGQKSPALPRPDAVAGEWHKSWRSFTKHICTNEERGLLLSYARLHFSHESAFLCGVSLYFLGVIWVWDYPCLSTVILCYVFMPRHKSSLSWGGG